MMNIMILDTAWGPKHGGINSFNIDFATGLAKYLGENGRVMCGVPYATEDEIRSAKETSRVTLLHANLGDWEKSNIKRLPASISSELQRQFNLLFSNQKINYWIGHDVISGDAAIFGAKLSGSYSVYIAHMHYEAYLGHKGVSGKDVLRLKNLQIDTGKRADYVFANGPFLQKTFSHLLMKPADLLIPGFASIQPNKTTKTLRAIATGRLDDGNDKIKLGSLAVAGFSTAVKQLNLSDDEDMHDMSMIMTVLGIGKDVEERALRKLSNELSGEKITINAVPYTEDRDKLHSELGDANIALMLSLHEGFGLVGWEAIAAETPLVLSRNSGLWHLIRDQFASHEHAAAHVKLIKVQGGDGKKGSPNYSEPDVIAVSNAIVKIASNLEQEFNIAADLKAKLIINLGCTWENTAKQLLEGIGLNAIELYDLSGINKSYIHDVELNELVGDWTAHYIEGSSGLNPKIITEAVTLQLSSCGNKLEGVSKSISRAGEIAEEFQDIILESGILTGESRVIDWKSPAGFSRFQLSCRTKNNEIFLDGVSSWVSSITRRISWSRYILMRSEVTDPDLTSFVHAEMEFELEEISARIRRKRRL